MCALVVRLGRPTRTLFGREVFSPTYMPPGKTDFIFFAPAGANAARLFRQKRGPVPKEPAPVFVNFSPAHIIFTVKNTAWANSHPART